jgi:hypothetical protein
LRFGGFVFGRKPAALLAVLALLLCLPGSVLARGHTHATQLRGAMVTPNWSIDGSPFERSAEQQFLEIADVCGMGGNLIRLHVDWSQLQPGVYQPFPSSQPSPVPTDQGVRRAGDYDLDYLSRIDQTLAWADQCHIRVILDLIGSPCWSIDPAPCRDDTWIFDPPLPGTYRTVSEYLLQRYPGLYALEVWNEPNHIFWKGTPTQYATLVNEAVAARTVTGSHTRILAGSFLMNGSSYLQLLYAAGMRGEDGISIHPYSRQCSEICGPFTNPSRPRSPFRTAIEHTHRVMLRHHDRGGIYLTEFGFATCPAQPACVDEATAARWTASSIRIAAGYRYVRGLTVFSMRDFADPRDPDPIWEMRSGLLRHDLTPKPAFDAVKRVIRRLHAHRGA